MTKPLLTLTLLLLPFLGFTQVRSYVFSSDTNTYRAVTADSVLGDAANDDEFYSGIRIGFPFTFNGAVRNIVTIQTNGFAYIGTSTGTGIGLVNAQGAVLNSAAPNIGQNIVAGLNLDMLGTDSSELSITRLGTAPNREFVIQWKNYTLYQVATADINFQIRLQENGNRIRVEYGRNSNATSTNSRTAQVGLRGLTASDYNGRTTPDDWSATTAMTANTQGLVFSDVSIIPSGLTFIWERPANVVDLGVKRIIPIPGNGGAVAPNQVISARVINTGDVSVDSVFAKYFVNNTLVASQEYSVIGGIAGGDSATITFNTPYTFLSGNNTLTVVANTRGERAAASANDTASLVVSVATPVTTFPFTEGFPSTTQLPAGWSVQNVTGPSAWRMAGPDVFVGSTLANTLSTVVGDGALFYNSFITSWQGSLSRAVSQSFDFSALSGARYNLIVSYMQSAAFPTATDSIQVQSTTNGTTFSRMSTLFRPNTDVPTGEGEWTVDTLDISNLMGQASVRFGFLGGGADGNNMAIDFIRIEAAPAIAVKPRTATTLVACPNPTTGKITLRGLPAHAIGSLVNVVDVSGKVHATRALATEMNLSELPVGLYYIVGSGVKAKVFIAK